jgi:tripartite ATP-independent transporter DctM subunit
MDATYAIAVMFLAAAFGMPIAFALILACLLIFLDIGTIRFMAIPQHMVGGVDSFILLAVPMFILAAKVMNSAKITDRIFNFAGALVRHIKGGLGHVNIAASLIFAGMSGSAVADAAGLGEIEIKMMKKRGYDGPFAAAITAASSVVGPIFPPSVPMVIYGGIAGASIAHLFLGGAIPAIAMTLFLMVATYFIARARGYPSENRASLNELWVSFRGAFFALLSPVIVLGAIVFGITTPTEAAAVAVLYSFLLGFAYRTVKLKDLPRLFIETALETGVLMLIVAAVSIFSWTITFQQIPQQAIEALFALTQSKAAIVLLIVFVLLILGLFMNPTPGLIVAAPFILPIAEQIGMDLVHLGVLMVLVLAIGLVTPPVGLCLYIVARIARVDVVDVVRECMPFILALALVALIVAYVPEITLFVPQLPIFNR